MDQTLKKIILGQFLGSKPLFKFWTPTVRASIKTSYELNSVWRHTSYSEALVELTSINGQHMRKRTENQIKIRQRFLQLHNRNLSVQWNLFEWPNIHFSNFILASSVVLLKLLCLPKSRVLSSFSPMSSIDADRELHKSGLWKLKTSLASFF